MMKKLLYFLLFLPLLVMGQEQNSNFSNNTISLGVIVSDLEESLKFYKDIIGMEETGGFSIDSEFGKRSGLTGGRSFDVKILKLANDISASEFKIMSFGNTTAAKDNFIQDKNGVRYITIFPKTTDAVIERLKNNNVQFLGDTPTKLGDGRTFILVQDPDGLFVELIGN